MGAGKGTPRQLLDWQKGRPSQGMQMSPERRQGAAQERQDYRAGNWEGWPEQPAPPMSAPQAPMSMLEQFGQLRGDIRAGNAGLNEFSDFKASLNPQAPVQGQMPVVPGPYEWQAGRPSQSMEMSPERRQLAAQERQDYLASLPAGVVLGSPGNVIRRAAWEAGRPSHSMQMSPERRQVAAQERQDYRAGNWEGWPGQQAPLDPPGMVAPTQPGPMDPGSVQGQIPGWAQGPHDQLQQFAAWQAGRPSQGMQMSPERRQLAAQERQDWRAASPAGENERMMQGIMSLLRGG